MCVGERAADRGFRVIGLLRWPAVLVCELVGAEVIDHEVARRSLRDDLTDVIDARGNRIELRPTVATAIAIVGTRGEDDEVPRVPRCDPAGERLENRLKCLI